MQSEHDLFETIAAKISSTLNPYVEQMGGGIECIVVNTGDGKHTLYFGTANETWGADVYTSGPDGEFQDGLSINTELSSETEDANVVAQLLEGIAATYRSN